MIAKFYEYGNVNADILEISHSGDYQTIFFEILGSNIVELPYKELPGIINLLEFLDTKGFEHELLIKELEQK